MTETTCKVCGERPASTASGFCLTCYAKGGGISNAPDAFVQDTVPPHVAEASEASPTLEKLETASSGWIAAGAIALVIGFIIVAVGLADSYAPTFNPWGGLLLLLGAGALQLGFLFYLLSRHARVQAEVALYVRERN